MIRAINGRKHSIYSPFKPISEPASATYIFDEHLEASGLPIISLIVNPAVLFDEHNSIYVPGAWYEEDRIWSGNYAKRRKDFERQATFELLDENKQLDIQQDVGIRINGRASRRFPKKVCVFMQETVMDKAHFLQIRLKHSIIINLNYFSYIIPVKIIMRPFLRDGLIHELVKDLAVDVQAYQPTIILINGEYWGIHNIRE